MIWKKNTVSYILWLLYTIAVGVSLVSVSAVLSERMGYSPRAGLAAGGILMVTEGVLVWLLSRIGKKVNLSIPGGKMTLRAAEGILIAVLLVLGLMLRIGAAGTADGGIYYDMAFVAEGQRIPQVVHGIEYVYLHLLHLVFLLFGNKLAAGIWLQIVLQYMAFIVFYVAVRRLSGVLPAVSMLTFSVFSPYVLKEALVLSPRMLYFLFYGIGLWMAGICLRRNRRSPAFYLLTGIVISLVIYLDIAGITLLFFMAGVFVAESGKSQIKEAVPDGSGEDAGYRTEHWKQKNHAREGGSRDHYNQNDWNKDDLNRKMWNKKGWVFLLCLLSVLLGSVAVTAVDVIYSGKKLSNVLIAWGKLYQPGRIQIPLTYGAAESFMDIAVLLAVLALGIFSFWCGRRSDKMGIWTLTSLVLALGSCFQVLTPEMDGCLWLYFFLTVMAGISVSNIFQRVQTGYDTLSSKEDAEGMEADEKNADEKGEELQTDNVVTVNIEGVTREVRLLDNPLPLPKKHEHKEMDFDLDVDVDDDFDI